MKYNGILDIAVGHSASTKVWKNKKWSWTELVQKLSEEFKTQETFKEYMAAPKADQSKIKDVGGYVGGYLRGGKRSPQNVVHRQLVTLDIDFAHVHFWDDFLLFFGFAAVLHSTHKHHENSPRYRLIFPLSREATPDEYVAVSRKIAGDLGIDLFDNTTFETNRLMFWPSCPKDMDYYFRFQDGPFVDVDEILNSYVDWTDTSAWPTSTKHLDGIKHSTEKQEDPESKKGVVGAFCRTYSISSGIDKFLPEEYTEAGEGRYTYKKGSTSSGLILYEDKFAFSHHGTDPCGGKLCNVFDLVRIHKFGHLDEGTTKGNPKSFTAMREFALEDTEVRKLIASENLSQSKYDFQDDVEVEQEDIDWMKDLELDTRGGYLSNATNLNIIFSNDPRLAKMFKQNDFDGKRYVFGNLPWRRTEPPEIMKNVDYSGVRNYLESIYGISGSLKIDDSLSLEFEKYSYHPIRDYLRSLDWDGVERLDRLFIEYFGTEDNIYNREASRKMIVGAVGRVMVPGIKFDLVITLVGEQGTGKSTFVNKLGGPWFSDTFITVHGKEALEQIQGAWIIEMAELAGLRKAEVEATKHFISKQEDMFRPAYARVSETYKRQCIFVGTTNNKDFLNDPSGNRRFLPIDITPERAKMSVFKDLNKYTIDQIWAEAFQKFKDGEKLYLSREAEILAKEEQRRHSEVDDRTGIVENYLDRLIPLDWEDMDLVDRKVFLEDPLSKKGKVYREYVCAAEVWCECLGRDKKDMDRYKTREVNSILKSLDGWKQSNSTKNFALYGKQKYYSREII